LNKLFLSGIYPFIMRLLINNFSLRVEIIILTGD